MLLLPLVTILAAIMLMALSDWLQLKGDISPGKQLFLLALALLTTAQLWAALAAEFVPVALLVRALWLTLALVGLYLLWRALFVALPVRDTYRGKAAPRLVDKGMYALCRHPGVLWLPLGLLPLAMGLGSHGLLVSGALTSLLNLLYAWYQDRYIFPRTIQGYSDYQRRIPMLLPTRRSLCQALGWQTKGGHD